ncbi:MAG TPA: DUF2945 domain-containing protein [Candidatus Tumulicola sp.]
MHGLEARIVEKKRRTEPKAGDRVTWNAGSEGTVTGVVKKKLTKPMKIKSHDVAASPENPEYLVESAKTGAVAAHEPSALKKSR